MNVAFDPWIPVVTTTGKPHLASLCSVFTEGEQYADLAVRPHERVALMRLFLCVTHAALEGPQGYDEWCEVPKRLPEATWNYLKTWEESFNLFHETKPWLQVAELNLVPSVNGADPGNENGWSTLNKLCLTTSKWKYLNFVRPCVKYRSTNRIYRGRDSFESSHISKLLCGGWQSFFEIVGEV